MDADLIRNLAIIEALILEVTRSTDGRVPNFQNARQVRNSSQMER